MQSIGRGATALFVFLSLTDDIPYLLECNASFFQSFSDLIRGFALQSNRLKISLGNVAAQAFKMATTDLAIFQFYAGNVYTLPTSNPIQSYFCL